MKTFTVGPTSGGNGTIACELRVTGDLTTGLNSYLNYLLKIGFANGTVVESDLTNGYNTITVPQTQKAAAYILVPPTANTYTLKLKGVTGDTGFFINKTTPTGPIVLDQDNYPASIGITTGGAVNGFRTVFL